MRAAAYTIFVMLISFSLAVLFTQVPWVQLEKQAAVISASSGGMGRWSLGRCQPEYIPHPVRAPPEQQACSVRNFDFIGETDDPVKGLNGKGLITFPNEVNTLRSCALNEKILELYNLVSASLRNLTAVQVIAEEPMRESVNRAEHQPQNVIGHMLRQKNEPDTQNVRPLFWKSSFCSVCEVSKQGLKRLEGESTAAGLDAPHVCSKAFFDFVKDVFACLYTFLC